MKDKIEAWMESVLRLCLRSPLFTLVGFVVFTLCLIIGVYFGGYHNADAKRRAEYESKTKANNKAMQAAILKAEKAHEEAKLFYDQAVELRQANDARADLRNNKDRELDQKISESDKQYEVKKNEIQAQHNEEITAANNMSDDERRRDICARLDKLAASDPSFREFKCTAEGQINSTPAN